MSNSKVRDFVERIERIETEQAQLAADKRDLYLEAEGNSIIVKGLRALIRKRKQDQEQRELIDGLVAQYELQL